VILIDSGSYIFFSSLPECTRDTSKIHHLNFSFLCKVNGAHMTKAETQFQEIAESLASKKIEVSKMFGMPCYKIKGKAFAGLFGDDMVFKLTGEYHKNALALTGSKLFDPSGMGRAMKEWVQVTPKNSKHWKAFADASLKYVSGK